MADVNARQRMTEMGPRVVDGRGIERLVGELQELILQEAR